ncbi:MAG: hypothetical protein IJD94_02235 [Clostridia bacterium]|nr:hypothetical protein [Clostridia bacterium]
MNNTPHDLKNAIDESLGSVHFNAQDMRAVLRQTRAKDAPQRRRAPARKKRLRLDLIAAAASIVLVVAPVTIFALRAGMRGTTDIKTITAAHTGAASLGETDAPSVTPAQQEDVLPAETAAQTPSNAPAVSPAASMSESEAIRIARACFEENCDTGIFTFEEYTVDVQSAFDYGADDVRHIEVTLTSIYDNGCFFRVSIDPASGRVLSFSTPKLATEPTRLNLESDEVSAWYAKNGAFAFTWPLEEQAEFSRRYEGGMIRLPREGEADEERIANRFALHIDELIALTGDHVIGYYITLYDGKAYADGQARYQVYCFPGGEIEDQLPDAYMILTFLAQDGTFETSQMISPGSP